MIFDCRDELLTTCMALIKNLAEREKMKSVSLQLSMRQTATHEPSLPRQTGHFQLETECAAKFDNIEI